uniref:protein disulfide-isomerase n=1 Tax=Sinocyclocheilus grahami TaxID=75366 RepID=A0A672P984_SINGR
MYEAAATRLKGIVPLAKVDCTASSSVCGKYGVSGYPTLKIFRDGEDSGSYDGPRTADGIVSHLKKQAGPSSVELKSEAEFQKFIGDRDASVVGFFADGGSAAQGEFLKAASALRESYRFAYTNVEDLLKKHDVDGEGIILFRPPHLGNKFEDGSVKFTEDKFTSAKIKKFIQDNIFGICPHMNDDNKDQLKGKDLLVAYYDVDYEKNPKGSNYWRNRFYLCQKKNQSLFVCSRDGKALEKFLQDYFDGNLKRYLKSETIPENNDGPVKVVVAENFDSIVNDESKDVLIEFYAPWCGHCKSLEPKFKELGEKLSDDPNIVIAKMDATANDVPSSYEVRGFPTIYFSPAGQKQNPKKYEGGREVSDFISYLKREATNTVVVQEDEKKSKKKKSEL